MKKLLLTLFSFFILHSAFSISYLWNGTTSSNWGTAANWTPSGIPDAGDDVVIASGLNICVLDANRTIDAITITTGTLDLGTNTLVSVANGVFTAGIVTNGTLQINSTVTNITTFTNTSFNASANLQVVSGRINLNGGTFDGPVTMEQTGTTSVTGSGGITFNGTFIFTLSGSGYFRTNGGNTFNQAVTLINNGTNYILLELTNGSVYNSTLTLVNNSTSQIRMAYQGNSQFNGNIEVNNTSSGEIRFGEQTGSVVQLGTGVVFSIGGGGFADGQLMLKGVDQADATAQSLAFTGSTTRLQTLESTWNGNISFIAPRLLIENSVFNGDVNFEKTQDNVDYNGGNTFNGDAVITHSGFVNSFRFGRTNPDIFNGNVTLHNLNDGHIRMADNSTGNQINGNLTVFNNSTNSVYFCNEGASNLLINGNIQFNSTGSSNTIIFGSAGNVITLNPGFTVSSGVFDAGELRFTDFVQLGATAQNLTLTGTGNFTSTNSTWNGNLTVTSPRLNTNGSTFNGTVNFEKNGNADESSGGNSFNQTTSLVNSSDFAFRFGITNPDIFNGNLSIQNIGNGRIELARNSASNQFNGDLVIENTGGNGIYIGDGGGTSTLAAGLTMSVGALGFSDGWLRISNLTQVGNTPQFITTTANGNIRMEACQYDGEVTYTSQRVFLIGNTFNNDVEFTKNGTGNDNSAGGNTFNGTTTLTNTLDGYLMMGGTNPDIYNDILKLTNTGTNIIYISYNSLGNQINGDVIVESMGSNGIRFGDNGGTTTIASGVVLSVGGLGFDSGDLRFANCTQLGATAQNLNLTGTARLLSMESIWNGALNFVSPRIYLRGSTFNNTAYWEKNGATDDNSPGGNTFNTAASIVNSSSNLIYFSSTNPDIFNSDVLLSSTGSSMIRMAYTSTGNQFNGNITVESIGTSTGIRFGDNGGDATLASGKTIIVGGLGFSEGELRFRNFSQLGGTTQSVTLTNTARFLSMESNWSGNVSFIAPRIYTTNTVYDGVTLLSKTGTTDDDSPGGNTFNQSTTITNSGDRRFRMAQTIPDIFNSSLFVTNTGTSQIWLADASSGNQFNGNIQVESMGSGGVFFGRGNGDATLAAGRTVTVGALGFDAGDLEFRNFSQLGGTTQSITLTNTARFLSMESNWSGNVSFIAPRMYTSGTVYDGITLLAKTGTSSDDSPGANIFNQSATISNSGDSRFRMAQTNPDIFNSSLLVTNTGTSQIWLADASSGNQFNGNIQVESVGSGGVFFGRGNGDAVLAAGQTVTLGGLGFNSGNLHFRNFTQSGATAQNLTLTGTAFLENYDSNWSGDVTFISPRHTTRGTTYNGLTYLEKNGANNDASVGGNTFNQDVEFVVSGTGYFMPSNTVANNFLQNATYVKTNSGAMYPSYNCESTYYGDININSNSSITFAANTNGRIILSGNASQFISDLGISPMPIFRKLRTNKTGAEVTLNIPIAISNELDLIIGNIHTDATNLLIMNDNAAVTSVSDAAYVHGPVRKIGNDAFTFPIGKDGFYRPASISSPVNAAHHFTAEYFFIDPDTQGYDDALLETPLLYLSDCEYWIIDRTNGTSNVNVTLSYKTFGSNGCSGVVDPTQLMVARWDGAIWRNHGNGGTTGTAANGTISTSGAVSSFSPFTLATLDMINPLPVEIIEFNAEPKVTSVLVSWVTNSEINNDYFLVERSDDGINFNSITRVEGAGNSTQQIRYEFNDITPLQGTSYYRLKQVDFNGTSNYTNIRKVEFDNNSFVIFPNPATSGQQVNIVGDFSTGENFNIKVYDAIGNLVKVITTSSNSIEINLASGIYLIEFEKDDFQYFQRLIVQP